MFVGKLDEKWIFFFLNWVAPSAFSIELFVWQEKNSFSFCVVIVFLSKISRFLTALRFIFFSIKNWLLSDFSGRLRRARSQSGHTSHQDTIPWIFSGSLPNMPLAINSFDGPRMGMGTRKKQAEKLKGEVNFDYKKRFSLLHYFVAIKSRKSALGWSGEESA